MNALAGRMNNPHLILLNFQESARVMSLTDFNTNASKKLAKNQLFIFLTTHVLHIESL